MEKITDGSKDLEKEFKEAAMKLLRELRTKSFEGEGTPIKKIPRPAPKERAIAEKNGPDTRAAGAKKGPAVRNRAVPETRPRRTRRKGDSIEVVAEKPRARKAFPGRVPRKAAVASKSSKPPGTDTAMKRRVAVIKKAKKFKKIRKA